MEIKDLQTLINEKAEEKFYQKWNSRFTDKDLKEDPFNESWSNSDERIAFEKITKTKEYDDFKKIMVKDYIEDFSKEVIEKARLLGDLQ